MYVRKLDELLCFFFFFNDTATTEIYTLSLHDALPISGLNANSWLRFSPSAIAFFQSASCSSLSGLLASPCTRSEEHTSELQSRQYLVCRLLLEKKKNNYDVPLFRISPIIKLPLPAVHM